ncbi:site-specific DNA-methyltransferase [Cupriavidus sp. UGS-1]|nr:site-specific DNA-methyltransferase [Cupriavidus sp. UGS-1]MCD9124033.1 site-specific DNA-methyltransferase [Cupriavidus sp. UGS-1]
MDALDLVRSLPAASVDMLLTDPPYSSGGLHLAQRTRSTSKKYLNSYSQGLYKDFGGECMDQRSWTFWCLSWLSAAHRAIKPGGLVVSFIDWRQLPALTDAVQIAGFTWRGIAVWDKTPGRTRPRKGGMAQQAEFIVWASKGDVGSAPAYLPGVFPVRLGEKKHLTEKPIEIARELVRLVPAGGVVCDPFAGSGTFLVAAKEAGLRWIGSELNDHYHALASERLSA